MRIMAYSMNYIWPVVLVLPYIFIIQWIADKNVGYLRSAGCLLLAFLAGNTQEVFNLPLSFTSFILMCYLLIKHHRVSRLFVGMCVALWIGTATVVFAPGTMNRGQSIEAFLWLKSSIYTWVLFAIEMPVLWLTLIACVCMICAYGKRALLRLCPFEMICMVLATLMSLVVHTGSRSLSGFQFFCLLVFLACISRLIKESAYERLRRPLNISSILIYLIFMVFQISQIAQDYRYKIHNHMIVNGYMDSPDGIVEYTPVDSLSLNGSYQYDFAAIRCSLCWNMLMRGTYGSVEKPVLLLTHDEMARLAEIGVDDSRRVPGDAGFYYLTDEIVVRPADSEDKLEPLSVKFKNKQTTDNPIEKLRLAMCRPQNADSVTETQVLTKGLGQYTLIHTRYGDFVVLFLEYHPLSLDKQ